MADEAKPDEKKEEESAAPAEAKVEEKAADKSDDKPKAAKPAAVPAKFKKLVDEVEKLSVLELSELVKVLEERFGVSATAPVAAAAAPAAAGSGEAEAAAEKAEYNVNLKDAGSAKINVIKAVREVSGLGLAESKAIVDGAPKVVLEKAKKEDAEAAKAKLEEAGATIELE